MTDTAVAMVEAEVLAVGEDSLAVLSSNVSTTTDPVIADTTATTGTVAIAAGDDLAMTEVTALSHTDDGSGTIAATDAYSGAVASGGDTLSASVVETVAVSTPVTDIAAGTAVSAAFVEGTGTGSGSDHATAITESSSSSYVGDENGGGAGVDALAGGIAYGDGSVSVSSAETYAAGTGTSAVAIGTAQSTASGSSGETTDAFIDLSGDGTISQSTSFDSPWISTDIATGVAVTGLNYTSDVTIVSDVDVNVASEVAVSGNVAELAADATAVGDETLVEVDATVLTTDTLSSVEVSMIAAVD